METNTNDGGPAFPVPGLHSDADFNGMSLRDYFAASARHEDLAIPETVGECAKILGIGVRDYNGTTHYREVVAKLRYEFADAMLRARARGEA